MFDIIIIGGGVAGMTAALYALRNNKKVLIIEKECVGGQISKSPKVENYPTKKAISGAELSDEIFSQINDLGVQFELENVESVTKENNIFNVKTDYNTYEAKSVIIATGAKPRMLNIQNEDKLLGKGVFYCAICDGPFYTGKEVALIGDANSALQYALTLSSYCSKVNVFTLFDKFFGEKTLIDQVLKAPNIVVKHNCKAVKLIGDEKLESILFENQNGILFEHKTEALFVAIGQVPDNEIFGKFTPINKQGYIISDETCLTATKGLYVAGDCRTKAIRQVTTAISDGAIAGTSACRYIDSL